MRQIIRLTLVICLLLVSGYVLTNKQFLFSKVMTNYYTNSAPFLKVTDAQMTVHSKDGQQAIAQQLIALRADVHDALSELLPMTDLSHLSVLLVEEGDDAYERYLSDNTIGVYFPMLNTMMLDSSGTTNIQHTFVHEYAHYLVDQQLEALVITEERLPDWFHEGVANYAEYRVFGELPFTYSRFHTVPFRSLNDQTAENAHTVYHQGFYAVAHLVHVYGEQIIMRIIDETNTAREFTNGFTRATNIHLATYHERFIYDVAAFQNLYSMVQTHTDVVAQQLQQRTQQYPVVNPASQDELLLHVALSIQLDERERLRTILATYSFLFQRTELYLQLADLLFTYDETLAQELLERGKALEADGDVLYEQKIAALYEQYE